MSLYNMLHGVNPLAGGLLTTLEFTPEQFGRFRDCHLTEVDGELLINVFTRCGGGNRGEYQDVFDWAKEQPTYVKDFDDAFDNTYATIQFNIPDTDAGKWFVKQLDDLSDSDRALVIVTDSFEERFNKKIEELKD